MAPTALSEVRGFLASVDSATCKEAAHRAISAKSADEAREVAEAVLGA